MKILVRFGCAVALGLISTSAFAQEDGEGFSGAFDYAGDLLFNTDGGFDTGKTYTGLAALAFDYSGGSWDWHMNIYAPHGTSITDRYVGDFAVVSNLDAAHEIHLEEFWFQKNFQSSSLRFGMLAADTEFWGSEYGGLFVSAVFGAPTMISANLPSTPIYPVAALGVRMDFGFGENNTMRFAVLDGDAGDPEGDNRRGTDIDLGQGALILAEAQWTNSRGEDQAADAFKLTGFVHTGDFFDSDGNEVRNNFGFAAIIDRAITDELGWFGRVGFAKKSPSISPWHIETGINKFNVFGTNATFGLGVAMIDLNENFNAAFELDLKHEFIVEASMEFPIGEHFSLQPDLQYIINPGGTEDFDNALVVGLRGKLSLGF